jgi:hypothetical protein
MTRPLATKHKHDRTTPTKHTDNTTTTKPATPTPTNTPNRERGERRPEEGSWREAGGEKIIRKKEGKRRKGEGKEEIKEGRRGGGKEGRREGGKEGKPQNHKTTKRGQGGIEPPTSSTLRRNHATRPLSRI